MRYTSEEVKKIIENHQHWLNEDCDGWEAMRADFSLTCLSGMNFAKMDLRCADFSFAVLEGANLCNANLRGANLFHADLKSANFFDADLRCAMLECANLDYANLNCTKLDAASLDHASLAHAQLDVKEEFRCGQILKEPMTGYKKTLEGVVITAIIPAGAIVFCINGRKCRTNKAHIVDIGGKANEVLHSYYDPRFEYRLNQDIEITDFDCMYNIECTSGFHFFRTRKEAEEYK